MDLFLVEYVKLDCLQCNCFMYIMKRHIMSTHCEAPIICDTYEGTIWWQLKAKLTESINFQTCCHGMYELKLAYL